MVYFSGLLYGKMGISLFFFQYSRYTHNALYNEYACHLIDLVKAQIHEDYPLDYKHGLAGVGVGFNYLKEYGYFDVGDEYISDIDLKIIKAISYERRLSVLTGFGHYFVSKCNNHIVDKDFLIKLTELIINHSTSVQMNVPLDTLSLLCDLYNLDIEKEKIEFFLSMSMATLIKNVQKESISEDLLVICKLSHVPSCSFCKKIAIDTLNSIFSKQQSRFSGIDDFQWLLRCEEIIKKNEYYSILPKIKNKILKNMSSFNLTQLDEFFSDNQNFAFQGGFTGLGLALLAMLKPENNQWLNLLKL